MTARRWTQQYEWNAHQPLALQGGVKRRRRHGDRRGPRGPTGMAADEDAMYTLSTECDRNHSVSDAT